MSKWISLCITLLAALLGTLGGCAQPYHAVVKPGVRLSALSPELQGLTDQAIETYLQAEARPTFPTAVAIARLVAPPGYARFARSDEYAPALEVPGGDEAAGWRRLVAGGTQATPAIVDQVQFIGTLLAPGRPTLKSLRDAAALLHAPVLLVYMQDDDAQSGYNDLAMAYWTIVGLFCVPGHTVGHYAACQAVLVDTRSGVVLATAEGEAKRKEHVLPGAVDIASDRTAREARREAVATLQANVRDVLAAVAARSSVRPPGQ